MGIMDWMRRRRKSMLILATMATFFVSTACATVNAQMPGGLRESRQIVNRERYMLEEAKHGSIKHVKKGLKEIKDLCSENKCEIDLGDMPEFANDLASLMSDVSDFEKGKIDDKELTKKIASCEQKHNHDKQAVKEMKLVRQLLKIS